MLIIISARLLPKRGIFPRETPEVLIKVAVFSSCRQVRARIHAVASLALLVWICVEVRVTIRLEE